MCIKPPGQKKIVIFIISLLKPISSILEHESSRYCFAWTWSTKGNFRVMPWYCSIRCSYWWMLLHFFVQGVNVWLYSTLITAVRFIPADCFLLSLIKSMFLHSEIQDLVIFINNIAFDDDKSHQLLVASKLVDKMFPSAQSKKKWWDSVRLFILWDRILMIQNTVESEFRISEVIHLTFIISISSSSASYTLGDSTWGISVHCMKFLKLTASNHAYLIAFKV